MPLPATRGGADGGDGVVGRRPDGDDRVAGVDRALEGMRAFDRHHVGDLGHAEQGGDAGIRSLPKVVLQGPHVGIAWASAATCGASTCAMALALAALATVSTFGHAGDLRGLGGDAGRIGGEHDDVDGIRLPCACAALTHLAVDALSLPSRCSATIRTWPITATPFCLSAATSSAASFTITPVAPAGAA